MKMLLIKVHGIACGQLIEIDPEKQYEFRYLASYNGPAVSLTMPVRQEPYCFTTFPPFFDGLLPEGIQLDGLLRIHKIDQTDYMAQLLAVGGDLIGSITVEEWPEL